uniref:Uncharacterized protein n=1 Tax=Zea mays TaxID=4577 RepID=B6SL00_MAIZE|nr:hypothetical protein [Zea mays]
MPWPALMSTSMRREVTSHLKIILVPGISSPRLRTGTAG